MGTRTHAAVGSLGTHVLVALVAAVVALSASVFAASPQRGSATDRGAGTQGGATRAIAKSGKARVGQELPWFGGWTTDNAVFNRDSLTRLPGRGRVLVFFATWCEPCEAGLREIADRQGDLTGAGVSVVLVAYREPAEVVTPWLASRGLSGLPLVLDRFGAVSDTFGVQVKRRGTEEARLPRTIIADATGRVTQILTTEGADYVDLLLRAGIGAR